MAFAVHNTCFLSVLILWCTCTIFVVSRSLHEEENNAIAEQFEEWVVMHGRSYVSHSEKQQRLQIFKDNVKFVEKFNSEGNHTYTLKVNKFADLTEQEFIASYTGLSMAPSSSIHVPSSSSYFKNPQNSTDVPTSIDWRSRGAVTEVKNQGECNCCWAFGAVAAVEGVYQIRTGKLISLSEQQVSDCDTKSKACDGGTLSNAFQYVMYNGGISSEEDYPYENLNRVCDPSKTANPAAYISGFEMVPSNDELSLMLAVASHPVSVGVEVAGPAFRFYSKGIFTGDCGTTLNHALAVVGYGVSDDGTKYWIVKNSWGDTWGDEGFMHMLRDSGKPEGLCGLAMIPTFPTV